MVLTTTFAQVSRFAGREPAGRYHSYELTEDVGHVAFVVPVKHPPPRHRRELEQLPLCCGSLSDLRQPEYTPV